MICQLSGRDLMLILTHIFVFHVPFCYGSTSISSVQNLAAVFDTMFWKNKTWVHCLVTAFQRINVFGAVHWTPGKSALKYIIPAKEILRQRNFLIKFFQSMIGL